MIDSILIPIFFSSQTRIWRLRLPPSHLPAMYLTYNVAMYTAAPLEQWTLAPLVICANSLRSFSSSSFISRAFLSLFLFLFLFLAFLKFSSYPDGILFYFACSCFAFSLFSSSCSKCWQYLGIIIHIYYYVYQTGSHHFPSQFLLLVLITNFY